jgi:hypothetical protein
VTILRPSSIWSDRRDWRTRLVMARGWHQGVEDPDAAQVANAYGQWVDRLYLSIACLFLPGAVGDFIVWLTARSVMSLLGPITLLGVCVAYLDQRRRFRRSLRTTGDLTTARDRLASRR